MPKIFIVIGLALTGLAAFASSTDSEDSQHYFTRLDAFSDGKLDEADVRVFRQMHPVAALVHVLGDANGTALDWDRAVAYLQTVIRDSQTIVSPAVCFEWMDTDPDDAEPQSIFLKYGFSRIDRIAQWVRTVAKLGRFDGDVPFPVLVRVFAVSSPGMKTLLAPWVAPHLSVDERVKVTTEVMCKWLAAGDVGGTVQRFADNVKRKLDLDGDGMIQRDELEFLFVLVRGLRRETSAT